MGVPVEFEPTETWVLEGRLEALLEAVRFETDHVAVTRTGGEALLESTRAAGTYAHVAVLHRRESLAGVSTNATAANDGDGDGPLRASFQHGSTTRTDSVKRALQPYRRLTLDH